MTAHETFLKHHAVIERVLRAVCRRHHLTGADREDFCSACRLHLLEDDSRVLRAFAGRSSIATYLTTVIARYFLDWRNAQWGKWRPSAEARRMGPLAITLERLLSRDGYTFEEAVETLRTNHGVTTTRDELESMASRFPHRRDRREVAVEPVADVLPAPSGRPDAALERSDATQAAVRTARQLEAAVAELPDDDRLLLRWRYEEGISVADISRMTGSEQKPLYRRFEAVLRKMRETLVARGLSADDVQALLADRGLETLPDRGQSSIGVRPYSGAGWTAQGRDV